MRTQEATVMFKAKRLGKLSGIATGLAVSAALIGAGAASAAPFDYGPRYQPTTVEAEPAPDRPRVKRRRTADGKVESFTPAPLTGPLQIVVSVARQRVVLFHDGKPVAEGRVSTGVAEHPTPMGVFSVISKARYHESNIYSGAPMPYMHRITWSGIALHEGQLPGRPASHGCIRLSGEFAQKLFRVSKLGARVVITRDAVAPVEVPGLKLFVPREAEPLPPNLEGQIASTEKTPPVSDLSAVAASSPAAPAGAKNNAAVQVLVSRKDGKLYVRQGFTPLFDTPVKIAAPEKPWGTHVFTMMEKKGDGVRWTSLTVPSGFVAEPDRRKGRKMSAKETERYELRKFDLTHPATAEASLALFEMPDDAVARIAPLLLPGSSLIVTDNALSEETGQETGLIVETH